MSDVEELAGQVSALLPQLAIRLVRFVRDLPENVTVAQAFLLHHLRGHGACTAAEVGEWMGVTSGPVTTLTKRLVARGLVERRKDETDRRVVWFRLTREGDQLVEVLNQHSRNKWGLVIEELGIDESRRAITLMENTLKVLARLR